MARVTELVIAIENADIAREKLAALVISNEDFGLTANGEIDVTIK